MTNGGPAVPHTAVQVSAALQTGPAGVEGRVGLRACEGPAERRPDKRWKRPEPRAALKTRIRGFGTKEIDVYAR